MISFFALMLEVIGSSFGLIFPAALFLCFYLAVCYSKVTGAFIGVITCIVIEVVLGRSTTALPLLFLVILYGEFWRLSGDRRYLITQSISGILIGIMYYFYCLMSQNFDLLLPGTFMDFSFILTTTITVTISAIGLPLMILALDVAAAKMGMNIFRTKQTASKMIP